VSIDLSESRARSRTQYSVLSTGGDVALQERVLDRLPPNNSEAEQSVLGSLLIDREAIVRVRPSLNPEDFYRGGHREIYAAIVDLYDKREPADLTTLPDELHRRACRVLRGDRQARGDAPPLD